MTSHKIQEVATQILKVHKYRVTDTRIKLLAFLMATHKPLTAPEIQKLYASKIDKVTLYRALDDFSQSKIINKLFLQDSVSHYEYNNVAHHHHHIVCDACGKIEEIEHCDEKDVEKEILKSSKQFKVIRAHSLEFFGTCKQCASSK